jgi:hypothetical protein
MPELRQRRSGCPMPELRQRRSSCPMPELRQRRSSCPMAGRGSGTQVPDSRKRVRTNPLGADLNSRRLARRVHAKDGMHTCAGLATEENHRKWFSSQALSDVPAIGCRQAPGWAFRAHRVACELLRTVAEDRAPCALPATSAFESPSDLPTTKKAPRGAFLLSKSADLPGAYFDHAGGVAGDARLIMEQAAEVELDGLSGRDVGSAGGPCLSGL